VELSAGQLATPLCRKRRQCAYQRTSGNLPLVARPKRKAKLRVSHAPTSTLRFHRCGDLGIVYAQYLSVVPPRSAEQTCTARSCGCRGSPTAKRWRAWCHGVPWHIRLIGCYCGPRLCAVDLAGEQEPERGARAWRRERLGDRQERAVCAPCPWTINCIRAVSIRSLRAERNLPP